MITYNQQLQEKKEKLEKILAEKIDDRNRFQKRLKSDPENIGSELVIQDLDLEIECVQFVIDQIGGQLKADAII